VTVENFYIVQDNSYYPEPDEEYTPTRRIVRATTVEDARRKMATMMAHAGQPPEWMEGGKVPPAASRGRQWPT
jgi:hypothetical protein